MSRLAWIGAIAFCLGCWWFLYDLLNTVGVFEALANLIGTSGLPCIRLVELVYPAPAGGAEPVFRLRGFRPLITQQDDLETHFVHLLDVPADHEAA